MLLLPAWFVSAVVQIQQLVLRAGGPVSNGVELNLRTVQNGKK